jgi:hypothetical protein
MKEKKYLLIYFVIILGILKCNNIYAKLVIERDPFEPAKSPERKVEILQPGQGRDLAKKAESEADKKQKNKISLTGIVLDKNQDLAIFSFTGTTQILGENDMYQNIIVLKIAREHVLLKSENKTYILMLGKEIII